MWYVCMCGVVCVCGMCMVCVFGVCVVYVGCGVYVYVVCVARLKSFGKVSAMGYLAHTRPLYRSMCILTQPLEMSLSKGMAFQVSGCATKESGVINHVSPSSSFLRLVAEVRDSQHEEASLAV